MRPHARALADRLDALDPDPSAELIVDVSWTTVTVDLVTPGRDPAQLSRWALPGTAGRSWDDALMTQATVEAFLAIPALAGALDRLYRRAPTLEAWVCLPDTHDRRRLSR